jgi:hypothetical protein
MCTGQGDTGSTWHSDNLTVVTLVENLHVDFKHTCRFKCPNNTNSEFWGYVLSGIIILYEQIILLKNISGSPYTVFVVWGW